MENYISLLLNPLPARDPYLLVILMGIILAGAFITSGFGVGGAILMTPLFMFFLPPKFGIGLLAPLMVLISGTGVRQYWKQWDRRHLLIVLLPSILGIWLGTYFLVVISAEVVRKIVGGLAILFGTFQFLSTDRPEWRNRLRPSPWQGVSLGFASGMTTAIAHTGGIVFSFYLLPNSRTKEIFVGTTVFIFCVMGLIKLGTYWYYEILTFPILLLSIPLIPALFAGSLLGRWFNRRISPKLFMRLLSIFLGVMGIKLILG